MVDKVNCRKWALLVCVLLLVTAGCDPGVEVAATPPPPVELVMVTDTPEPELINPVKAVFKEFMTQAAPVSAALCAKEDAMALSCSLSLDMQLQRLKQFFAVFDNLLHLGGEDWEGTLVGAMQGSATINGSEGGSKFSALLWDGTKIVGSVNGNYMRADWLYSETITPEPPVSEDGETPDRDPEPKTVWHVFRSAGISLADGSAAATLFWEDGHAGLLLSDGNVYLAQTRDQVINTSLQPYSWADWGFINDTIQKYAISN